MKCKDQMFLSVSTDRTIDPQPSIVARAKCRLTQHLPGYRRGYLRIFLNDSTQGSATTILVLNEAKHLFVVGGGSFETLRWAARVARGKIGLVAWLITSFMTDSTVHTCGLGGLRPCAIGVQTTLPHICWVVLRCFDASVGFVHRIAMTMISPGKQPSSRGWR